MQEEQEKINNSRKLFFCFIDYLIDLLAISKNAIINGKERKRKKEQIKRALVKEFLRELKTYQLPQLFDSSIVLEDDSISYFTTQEISELIEFTFSHTVKSVSLKPFNLAFQYFRGEIDHDVLLDEYDNFTEQEKIMIPKKLKKMVQI